MRREAPNHARTPRGCAGFTLIEVMIALLLVIALAAVAWASLSPMRNRVAMDEACAMVAAGIDQSRAMAASSNQVLEVRASIAPDALEIQTRPIAASNEDRDRADEERPWAVLVRITGSFAREEPSSEMGSEAGMTDGEPEHVSIGVVMPDGSMVPGVPLRLKDSEDRWTVVRVGTWMTRLEVEAAAASSDGASDAADASAGEEKAEDQSEARAPEGAGSSEDAGQ